MMSSKLKASLSVSQSFEINLLKILFRSIQHFKIGSFVIVVLIFSFLSSLYIFWILTAAIRTSCQQLRN